jgi:hypothetical protein
MPPAKSLLFARPVIRMGHRGWFSVVGCAAMADYIRPLCLAVFRYLPHLINIPEMAIPRIVVSTAAPTAALAPACFAVAFSGSIIAWSATATFIKPPWRGLPCIPCGSGAASYRLPVTSMSACESRARISVLQCWRCVSLTSRR